jgi:hypothetical protein
MSEYIFKSQVSSPPFYRAIKSFPYVAADLTPTAFSPEIPTHTSKTSSTYDLSICNPPSQPVSLNKQASSWYQNICVNGTSHNLLLLIFFHGIVVDTVCAEALGLIPVEMKTTFCYYSIF